MSIIWQDYPLNILYIHSLALNNRQVSVYLSTVSTGFNDMTFQDIEDNLIDEHVPKMCSNTETSSAVDNLNGPVLETTSPYRRLLT